MPKRTRGKGGPADNSPDSLIIKPGTRFWLTIADTAYEGPAESAPEPVAVWVEVASLGLKGDSPGDENAVTVTRLHDAGNPSNPLIPNVGEAWRWFSPFPRDAGYDSFLEIKIKNEYAELMLGGILGTTPINADPASQNNPEIPVGHPPEITLL